ncbi:MAG: tetratricopeptide repeat protein [Candidatus Saliniplasma sp.]
MKGDDKYAWNNKGRVSLEMKKPGKAKRAFEKALEIDPEFESAEEGLQISKEKEFEMKLEEYARRILEFECERNREISKEEAFKICNIPYNYIDDVFKFISTREGLDFHALDSKELNEMEKASRIIISKLVRESKKDLFEKGVRLCDIVTNFEKKSVDECKRVLEYIRQVVQLEISSEEIDEKTERLLRKRVLELPKDERDILSLISNLNVGIYQARKLQTALEKFEGTSYQAPSTEITSLVQEEEEREYDEEKVGVPKEEKKIGKKKEKKDEEEEVTKEAEGEEEFCHFCGDPTHYKHDCGDLAICPQCEGEHAGETCPECGGVIGSADKEDDEMLL